MELDIDQLHSVIEGKLKSRDVGQTTADLVLLAQSVEFTPKGILVFVYAPESGHPGEMFRDILRKLDLYDLVDTVTKDVIRFKNECRVHFVNCYSIRVALIGKILDNVFIDHFAEKKMKQHDFIDIAVRLRFPEPRF